MTRRTGPTLIVLVLGAAFAACAQASGEVRFAENDDSVDDTSPAPYLGCDPTEQIDAGNGNAWADLYRDLFSASGAAGCGNKACHGSEQGAGFKAANIACFDEVGCRDSFRRDLVRLPRDAEDPEGSALVSILRHCDDDRMKIGLMPKEPKGYFFSRKSIERVKAWIVARTPD
jgi:hypothetical protein